MKHVDLFAGGGFFHLAVESVFGPCEHIVAENDLFCQKWLRANFPDCRIISDIRDFKHDGSNVFILTGGFPCQPFSVAGKRAGIEDNRFLWPEMLRVIREVRPTWIVAENVPGIDDKQGMVLDRVCTDMEASGYEVGPPIFIPACAVNAPHRRQRVWIVAKSIQSGAGNNDREASMQGRKPTEAGTEALRQRNGEACTGGVDPTGADGLMAHSNGRGGNGRECEPQRQTERGITLDRDGESGMADTFNRRPQNGRPESNGQNNVGEHDNDRPAPPKLCGWNDYEWITGHDGKQRRVKPGVRLMVNGYPHRNDLLRMFGNAIVWQVAAEIMQSIKAAE